MKTRIKQCAHCGRPLGGLPPSTLTMRLRQWPAPSHPVEEDAAHSLPRSHCGQWGTHQGRVAADCPSLWHPARPALCLGEHRLLLPRGANSAAQNWLSERVATGRDVGTGTPLSVVQPLSTPARCRSLGAAEASRKTSRWHPPPPPRGTRPRPGTRDRSPDALQTPTCKRTRGAEGRVRQVQKKKKSRRGNAAGRTRLRSQSWCRGRKPTAELAKSKLRRHVGHCAV